MTRRRFFRVLTLALFLLCLAAWTWSRTYSEMITYHHSKARMSAIELDRWGIAFHHSENFAVGDGWSHSRTRLRLPEDPYVEAGGRRVLGFVYYNGPFMFGMIKLFVFRIPLWFPTLVLTGLALLAWRRERPQGGRGFATEPPANATREVGQEKSE